MNKQKIPAVAIIGRPNVGKSTVFNCFAGARKSIVSDIPGTTRDALTEKVSADNFDFLLVDTAGLTDAKGDNLEDEIQTQAEIALENADIIMFVVDGKKLLTLDDEIIVDKLRRSRKPIIFVANKIDDGNEAVTWDLSKLGFGMPLIISAKNYVGIWDLEEAIEKKLAKLGYVERDEQPEPDLDVIKVAFVGRPNVGKSSLLNSFLGTNRSVVSDVLGTTRDSIDEDYVSEDGQKFTFVDTAGIQRRGKLGRGIDFWSSVRTVRAIEDANICVLLIDALDGVTHQDLTIAGKIVDAGKGLIIGVNKFDLVREQTRTEDETDERDLDDVKMWGEELDKVRQNYLTYLSKKINFVPWAPVTFFSAKTGRGIKEILKSAQGIAIEQKKRVGTSELNKWIPEVYYGHVIPTVGTKRGKIKFVEQVDNLPPKFLFFVNNAQAFHFSYKRYLENKIREKYGFFGTPIVIEMRDSMKERKKKK